jgi:hypothetical protein
LEDDRVFVLFFRGMLSRTIPKRVFADLAAAQAFRALLSRKVGPPGVVRKLP